MGVRAADSTFKHYLHETLAPNRLPSHSPGFAKTVFTKEKRIGLIKITE